MDADPLATPEPFDRRLERWLDRERSRWGLRAIGIVEIAAPNGVYAPTWRVAVPVVPPPIDPDTFDRWRVAHAVIPATDPELAALGAPFAGGPVELVPLVVSPPLAAGADTVVVVAGALPPADLGALRERLIRGLEEDRRLRIAETVLAAFEAATDPMEITDRHARLLYANRAWERRYGYPRTEAVGRTAAQLFRDADQPLHDSAFYRFAIHGIAAGEPWLGLITSRTATGERVYAEVAVAPFEAEAAAIQGNFAVRRELGHRIDREAALENAHREFRVVLAAIPDAVAVIRDGRVYFANRPLLEMVGDDEAEVIGRTWLDYVHPDDRPLFTWSDVARVRVVARDGRVRIAEVSSAGAVSFEGKLSTILVARDRTDHHLAQEQLARTERLSALGSLAAGVAHELNNPLAYVMLNLGALQTQVAPGTASEALLREAADGVRRIHRIVDELRGFTGSDTAGPVEPVSVVTAITAAVNLANNEIRHRAALERSHDPDAQYVLGREGPIVQVLVNLLVNAAQSIRSDIARNVIRVESRVSDGGRIEIAVADTGSGIPPELRERLFEPFVTTKRTGSGRGGSGLGLAISKRIVDELGGWIAIESEVGRGTTVTVTLPRASVPVTASRPSSPDRVVGPAGRVLVVDDEAPITRALHRLLGRHRVESVHDAAAALERLTGDPGYDVVLCDLMMPGLAGWDLYAAVCAVHPELATRFVFMTGGAFSERGSEFVEQHASRVIAKPFDPERIVAWIDALVSERRR